MERKNMKYVVGVILLCIGASVIPTAISQDPTMITIPVPLGEVVWSDNFDSYEKGSNMDGQGGWFAWEQNPIAGALVTDVQARSTPHSVEIKEDSDLVHTWIGINAGNCTFHAWQYIPNDFSGESYFILLSEYNGGASFWSTQIAFSSDTGMVISQHELYETPMIKGEWVEIRVEIDFNTDTQKIYYDDYLLSEKSWTNGVSEGGPLQLGAVDLFANAASPVYYDDISIYGETAPVQPDLEIDTITGGFGIKAVVKNIGDGDATNVQWKIALDGGLIIIGKETTGSVLLLTAGNQTDIKSSMILGIGKTTITVTATCAEGDTAEATASGFVFLFFVLGVK